MAITHVNMNHCVLNSFLRLLEKDMSVSLTCLMIQSKGTAISQQNLIFLPTHQYFILRDFNSLVFQIKLMV